MGPAAWEGKEGEKTNSVTSSGHWDTEHSPGGSAESRAAGPGVIRQQGQPLPCLQLTWAESSQHLIGLPSALAGVIPECKRVCPEHCWVGPGSKENQANETKITERGPWP